MMDSKILWDSVRNSSGWPWALGAIRQDPACLRLLGPNWNESLLHWAMLGSLEACSELLSMDQNLLAQLDSEGRTALDWGMEKIYFMKEEAKGAGLDGRGAAMVSQAKSCVLHGLNWILAQKFEAPWCGSGRRFLQLALSCGELEIALLAGRAGAEAGPDVWLCGLAAPWNAPLMAKAYLAELASRFGLEGDSVAFGLPLGLHAAQLWCAGAIDDDALLLLHEAGVRADQETEDASLESLYAASAKSGTDKLDQILVKLGL